MRNITVSVADVTYREARIWAAENNTSISAAVEYMLENIRGILSVRKPPPQPRRGNRYELPQSFSSNLSCEDVMKLVNYSGSKLSVRKTHARTAFEQL
jgi:hypothetical protein